MESLFHITKIKDINNDDDNDDCYELIMPEDIINHAKLNLSFMPNFLLLKWRF